MRARFGLVPGRGAQPAHDDLGYVGREFRVYEYMQVGFAVRFYATLHERWDAEALARALQTAGLEERFDVRRMKRAYKRALVLAFALAASPHVLVVEGAEEFDEPGARALLERAVADAPTVVVTYAAEAAIDRSWFDDVLCAPDIALAAVATLRTTRDAIEPLAAP